MNGRTGAPDVWLRGPGFDFCPCFAPKNPQLRHHAVITTVPYARDRTKSTRFASLACPAQQRSGSSGGIVSSFRLICIAALTVAMIGFVAGAAIAQNATATDQSGKPYLAGLHPPHAHDKPAQKTSHVSPRHKPTKMARPETHRRPIAVATAKAHRSARLADRINSRVAWPSVEPAAADERPSSETVLQFALRIPDRLPRQRPGQRRRCQPFRGPK